MIWWILGIALFVIICVFVFLPNRGADMKNRSDWAQNIEDDVQEKAVTEMQKKRDAKKKLKL